MWRRLLTGEPVTSGMRQRGARASRPGPSHALASHLWRQSSAPPASHTCSARCPLPTPPPQGPDHAVRGVGGPRRRCLQPPRHGRGRLCHARRAAQPAAPGLPLWVGLPRLGPSNGSPASPVPAAGGCPTPAPHPAIRPGCMHPQGPAKALPFTPAWPLRSLATGCRSDTERMAEAKRMLREADTNCDGAIRRVHAHLPSAAPYAVKDPDCSHAAQTAHASSPAVRQRAPRLTHPPAHPPRHPGSHPFTHTPCHPCVTHRSRSEFTALLRENVAPDSLSLYDGRWRRAKTPAPAA